MHYLTYEEYARKHPKNTDSAEIYLGYRIGKIALRQVADWLRQCPGQWTRYAMARDKKSRTVSGRSPRACRWCALGRLEMLTDHGKFSAVIDGGTAEEIADFNDMSETSTDAASANRISVLVGARGPRVIAGGAGRPRQSRGRGGGSLKSI